MDERKMDKEKQSTGAGDKDIEDNDEMIHLTSIRVKNHFSLILVGFHMRFYASNALSPGCIQ